MLDMHVLITDAYISCFLDYLDSIYIANIKYYWMLINIFFYVFVCEVGCWGLRTICGLKNLKTFLALTVSPYPSCFLPLSPVLVLAFSIFIVSSITAFHFPCHFLPSIDSNLGISHFSERRLQFRSVSALCHLTALFFHIYFCLPSIKTLHKALFPQLI